MTTSRSAPARTTTASGGPGSSVPAPTVSLRLYFMRTGKLAVAARSVPASPAVATAAVSSLLAGPTPAEALAGLSTAIPADTVLRGVSIANGAATVDLSSAFSSGGGSLSMLARLAQVTYTLTQFPTVSGVVFRVEGAPATVFGGEGIVLDHPSTRSSFEAVTPAILVEGPTPGIRVTSPLRVWGTANVFEAAFRVELTDRAGRVIGDWPVQATSGSGTRGTFDFSIPLSGTMGAVTVSVFDLSAKDGSRQDVVAIPVQLG